MHVEQIWRFPVKSIGGERLDVATVGPMGIEGDRGWGLHDPASGLILTGRRQPELLFASATLIDGRPVITLPDGTETDDDATLSAWLGRDVSLQQAESAAVGTYEIELEPESWVQWSGPEGSFHDSTKSRISLVSAYSLGEWDRRRFRTNVILADAGADDNEDGLVGTTVTIGSSVLNIKKQIDRCIMVTRPQPDGIERDLEVLKTINKTRDSFLAVGALIESPGEFSVGDELVPAS